MEILTAQQMYTADKKTHAQLISESLLIENAAFASACQISKNYTKRPVTVLCGTGNNAADGFALARILYEWGWDTDIAFFGKEENMTAGAKEKAKKFKGKISPLTMNTLKRRKAEHLFVDAVFGIGLSRPLTKDLADFFNALNENGFSCVALDIPSGIRADTGELLPTAPICEMTITFCRPKIAHFLYPSKEYVGKLKVCQIGIPDAFITEQNPSLFENTPDLFHIPEATPYDYKYTRGAVLVRCAEMTGACRLAASAASRAFAGWVAISCPQKEYPLFAQNDPHIVLQTADTIEEFYSQARDPKITAVIFGMGAIEAEATRKTVEALGKLNKPVVLDAGALPFIKGIKGRPDIVLTPHSGEFLRLFPHLQKENKLRQALIAAEELNCTVVLKGADTVITSPEGKAVINSTNAFHLSTAGSGDVLDGIIGAMLSKRMPAFQAACAGVRLHSQAAEKCPKNMIAQDIIACLK